MRAPLLLMVIATTVLAMPVASHSTIIAVEFDGDVYSIDEATGGCGFVGNVDFIQSNSMAQNAAGTLYSTGDSNSALITIDPSSGDGTQVAPLPGHSIRALAFSPADVLYAAVGCSCDDPNQLYTVNVSTGNMTLVGNIPFLGVQAMTFSPGGVLYGFDVGLSGAGLIVIDPSTGAAVDVNSSVGGDGTQVQTIAFSPNGGLYGARDSLYAIDVSTGVLSFIGNGPYSDIRGMEFAVVPEPGTGLLVVAGLLGLAGWRRARA